MSSKRKIIAGITLIVVLIGLAAAVVLVRQRQILEKEAAVSEGVTQVWLEPETASVDVGGTFTTDIMFNSAGIAISAVQVQLDYPYGTPEPPITVSEIQINAALPSQGWSFPITTFVTDNGNARVRISAINVTTSGFISEEDTKLATVVFRADSTGTINTTFDAQESKITTKAAAEDILLIPTSSGTYTAQEGAAATPTPTTEPVAPTATPTNPPAGGPTATPTQDPSIPTMTPTPTTEPGVGGGPDPSPTPTNPPTGGPTATPTTSNSNGSTSSASVNITSISEGQEITDTTPTISGTAAANSTVSLRITSEVITGSTTADSDGDWSWTPTTALAGGSHTLTATATAPDGAITTDAVNFTVVTSTGETELPETAATLPLIALSIIGGLLMLGGGLRLGLGRSNSK